MDRIRHDLPFLPIPSNQIKDFDDGKKVVCTAPTSWNLNTGERIYCEFGQTIFISADIIDVTKGEVTTEVTIQKILENKPMECIAGLEE